MPKLTDAAAPISPYRVIWDLLHTVDVDEHDHHARRRQPARPDLAVLAQRRTPLTYIGWGKTTQLGYGLGLAMGAKLAEPGQALHQLLGRRGHRHDRHGLRDRRPRAHPDPLHPVEQLLDGDRAEGDGDCRPRSTAPPTSPATTPTSPRPSAATASASPTRTRSSRRSSAASRQTQNGRPGAARVHHAEGDRDLILAGVVALYDVRVRV